MVGEGAFIGGGAKVLGAVWAERGVARFGVVSRLTVGFVLHIEIVDGFLSDAGVFAKDGFAQLVSGDEHFKPPVRHFGDADLKVIAFKEPIAGGAVTLLGVGDDLNMNVHGKT